MSDPKTSRCLCGNVELAISGEPIVMAYCHCDSCRSWFGAPIHAAALWPTERVRVVRGEDRLGLFKRTEVSHRYYCRDCGAPVIIRHPALGLVDIPGGSVSGLAYAAGLHVNYQEKVLAVRDGLPKFKDFPKEFGGSGETIPE